jgi:hypothetical protein
MSGFTEIICEDTNPSEVEAAAYALATMTGFLVGFASAKAGASVEQFHGWCREGFENSARKSHETHAPASPQNPWRALNPEAFDKGARLNQRAEALQSLAKAGGFNETEVIIALGSALGQETGAMLARHPSMTLEQLLDLGFDAAREQAYSAAGLKQEDAKELSEYQFNELTNRIVKAAATNTLPIDFLAATAKALALLIVTTARRDETPMDELVAQRVPSDRPWPPRPS